MNKIDPDSKDYSNKASDSMADLFARLNALEQANEEIKAHNQILKNELNLVKSQLAKNTEKLMCEITDKNKEVLTLLTDKPTYYGCRVKISEIKNYVDEQIKHIEETTGQKFDRKINGGISLYPVEIIKHCIIITDDENNVLIDGSKLKKSRLLSSQVNLDDFKILLDQIPNLRFRE
jgi:hypothetical protein